MRSFVHSFIRLFVHSFIRSFSSVTQHARHAHAQVTRETHHKRCTSSHLFSNVAPGPVAPLPPLCVPPLVVYVFTVTMNTHGAHESSSSVSVGAGDVLRARALSSLPALWRVPCGTRDWQTPQRCSTTRCWSSERRSTGTCLGSLVGRVPRRWTLLLRVIALSYRRHQARQAYQICLLLQDNRG